MFYLSANSSVCFVKERKILPLQVRPSERYVVLLLARIVAKYR